jgi:hypothetical protein
MSTIVPTNPAPPVAPPPVAPPDPSQTQQPAKDFMPPPEAAAPWGARLRWYVLRYLGVLVMDCNEHGDYVMSLGKVSAAALLAQAMFRWGIDGTDIPQSMLQTLWALLAYNFGSKGIAVAHAAINGPAPNPNPMAAPTPPKTLL